MRFKVCNNWGSLHSWKYSYSLSLPLFLFRFIFHHKTRAPNNQKIFSCRITSDGLRSWLSSSTTYYWIYIIHVHAIRLFACCISVCCLTFQCVVSNFTQSFQMFSRNKYIVISLLRRLIFLLVVAIPFLLRKQLTSKTVTSPLNLFVQ